MPGQFLSSERAEGWSRHSIYSAIGFFLASASYLTAQQPPAQKLPNPTPATKVIDGKSKPNVESPAASAETLAKFNDALESLAAKVSPAVVQILVTGYGPLHDENRTQTALIVRQHAVGSGVIVDPSGYIMTNAHVVEGAQRIRVALPLPGDSSRRGQCRLAPARPG
jgi:serine protease Do